MDDHLIAVGVQSSGITAEDHGQPILAQTDSAQRPQIVMVERRRLAGDGRPAGLRVRFGLLADGQAAERILPIDRGCKDGKHFATSLPIDRIRSMRPVLVARPGGRALIVF